MTDFLAVALDIVNGQQEARRAFAGRGANLNGWASPEAPTVESVGAVIVRLVDEEAERAIFRASPDGRFLQGAKAIADATGDERLLQCFTRGLGEEDRAWAARLLSQMEGPAADQARFALEDIQRDMA